MQGPFIFFSHSEDDTHQFGEQFAAALTAGGLTIALNGDLGAGKTNFVRAVCTGFGADESQVNSPTFVLLQTYVDGRLSVAHFDTYRLGDVDEFLAIGGEEYLLDSDFVCFVEWSQRIHEVLPADRLTVDIDPQDATSRRFTITASGPTAAAVLQRLRDQVSSCE